MANKPAKTRASSEGVRADLRTWQLWYEQIKAGNRTFRFEDDPQEYNLQGPVRVSIAAAPAGRPSRSQPPAPAAEEPPATRSPALAAVFTALAVALGFVVWRFLRHAPGGTGKAA